MSLLDKSEPSVENQAKMVELLEHSKGLAGTSFAAPHVTGAIAQALDGIASSYARNKSRILEQLNFRDIKIIGFYSDVKVLDKR